MRFNKICLLLTFLGLSIPAHATDIYVAPNGDDANSGTKASPLKTLDAARQKAQQAKPPVQVLFRAGTYPVTTTVVFRQKDSGTSKQPIVYKSHPGETAFFTGLRPIDPKKFEKVIGDLAKRVPRRLRSRVYAQTITDPETQELLLRKNPGLTHNNQIQLLATTPNKGFLHVDRKSVKNGSGKGTPEQPLGPKFRVSEPVEYGLIRQELARGGQQAFVLGYLSAYWLRKEIPISRLDGNIFTLQNKTSYKMSRIARPRLRIINMLAALDARREWFFDKTDNRLYLCPDKGKFEKNDLLGVWAGTDAILVSGANHLRFENLVFQDFAAGKSDVIRVERATDVLIGGCTFRRIGGVMAPFTLYNDSTDCTVTSCDLYDNIRGPRLGGGSISKSAVTLGNNVVENCHFTQVDTFNNTGSIISVSGAGNIFRNNLGHNANAQPITYTGVDHLFERNEIFNVGVEEGDGGAFYTGANIYSFGNRLRQNFVHHIMNVPGILGRAAMFSDDYDAGEIFEENVFFKCGEAAIKMNAGSGHTVKGNVIIASQSGVSLLGRPETYKKSFDTAQRLLKEDPDSKAKNAYLGRAEKVIGDFANNATGTYNKSWDNSFWAKRYPLLRKILAGKGKLGMYPIDVQVEGNCFAACKEHFQHTKGFGSEKSSIDVTPADFVRPKDLNLKFKKRNAKYPKIPFEKIGLVENEYRKSIPRKKSYRRKVYDRWKDQQAFGGKYDPRTINRRLYYNTGKLVIKDSQKGLGVREEDALKNQPDVRLSQTSVR